MSDAPKTVVSPTMPNAALIGCTDLLERPVCDSKYLLTCAHVVVMW